MTSEAKYQVKLASRAEREAKIRASATASTLTQDFYEFRNQKTQLKVIRIDIDLPMYRMENFRTFIAQTEYTVREGQPANYFQANQENESVQQLQHAILTKLAHTGQGDSIVPVIDVLKKQKQREPILITYRGVVVNGNRRLAGMRELYSEDSIANASFSHVECMVLPEDATQDDIVDIEAALQGKPETRLDYDWIGDARLISKLISMGRSPKQIAERLDRREKEIRNSLQALSEAELYLKDWAKAEGEYSRVQDEQFFNDLPALLQGKDAALQEGSRVIAWTLYDNREDLRDRLYAFNVAFGKRAADVLDRVASDLGIPLAGNDGNSEGDGFAVSLDEGDGQPSFQPIIEALRDPERKSDAVDSLIEASRGVIESERNQKSGDAALKAVRLAHSKLVEVDLTKAAPNTYTALEKQLEAVGLKTNELLDKLAKFQKPEAGAATEG